MTTDDEDTVVETALGFLELMLDLFEAVTFRVFLIVLGVGTLGAFFWFAATARPR